MKETILAALALTLLPFLGKAEDTSGNDFDRAIRRNNATLFTEGRHIFRYDTFGDEAFWGDALKLHLALAGTNNGGAGPGASPQTALAVGLKVDVVNHYDSHLNTGLTDAEKADLVEYLKSL